MPDQDAFPVTHPPLSSDEFVRIADNRRSADAILLLREVERLRVLEVKAVQLARLVLSNSGGASTHQAVATGIIASSEGRLPGGGQFKV